MRPPKKPARRSWSALVATATGMAGLGLVVAECLNQTGLVFKLIGRNLSGWSVAGLTVVFYLLHTLLNEIETPSCGSRTILGRLKSANTAFRVLIALLILSCLPLLWWGVILKLAAMGRSGTPVF